MEDSFRKFVDQIPSILSDKVETYADSNIMVFKPQFFLDAEVYLQDYHFALLTSDPPPIRVERQVYQFKKWKMLAMRPETRMLGTEYTPTRQYIAMNIKKDFLEKIAKDVNGKEEVVFTRTDNPYSSKLVNLIFSFIEELKNSEDKCPLMLQSMGTQMGIQLLRETGSYKNLNEKKPPINRSYVNLAKEYMTAFYNANIKIEDICKEIHLSPYYFIRMFKEQTGQSPHEFLLSVRVRKAEELLKSGSYSIEEVARLCGYVSSAHFSNHFKRVVGIPPSEYKRTHFIMGK